MRALPLTLLIAPTLIGLCAADETTMDDSLAYHVTTAPSLTISPPTALPSATALPALVDPMAATATTATTLLPDHNSNFLESTAGMVGTIGMLLLVFRRRMDTA